MSNRKRIFAIVTIIIAIAYLAIFGDTFEYIIADLLYKNENFAESKLFFQRNQVSIMKISI